MSILIGLIRYYPVALYTGLVVLWSTGMCEILFGSEFIFEERR